MEIPTYGEPEVIKEITEPAASNNEDNKESEPVKEEVQETE
tara:strand:- start:913 stop:1035 length:123 start_codon:yes stop_codon:yes gene_type:complete